MSKSTGWFGLDRSLTTGLGLMAVATIAAAIFLVFTSEIDKSYPYLFLVPWLLLLAVVLIIPSAILYRKGRLTYHDPIVFATWGYFFPAFVIGGLGLAFGWSQPYFLSRIQDAHSTLPYSVILLIVGFSALALGCMLPAASKVGELIERYLPDPRQPDDRYVKPSLILLGLGLGTTVLSLILGIAGYQMGETIASYEGLLVATTLFANEASFILLYIVFKNGRWRRDYLLVGLLMFTFLLRALFAGNRGSFLGLFFLVILAFTLSGRMFTVKHAMRAGVVFVICLVGGMIYGTTFRMVKGSESRVGIGEVTKNIVETFDTIGQNDSISVLQSASATFAERIDTLSSLAVVVSNYEQLLPYEEQYGLDNNIWKDITTFFIPRLIWNDKPVASDARKYGELYFDYGQNSFAITPVGDLLRNFGAIGVPIGMFLLGFLLRVMYRALVEAQERRLWRAALYYMLLVTISYEGFYGLIVPNLVKLGAVSVFGLILVNFLSKRMAPRAIRSV